MTAPIAKDKKACGVIILIANRGCIVDSRRIIPQG